MQRCSLVLAGLAGLAACSDSGSEPPLSDAISLACPDPGALPFRLASRGFQNATNRMLVIDEPRNKDEASDTLGNPGGVSLSVYALDSERPSTAPIAYRGEKARTQIGGGLLSDPLPGENVSLWYHDPDLGKWQEIGDTRTAGDGSYVLPSTGFVAPSGRPIYAMLEADGSCAVHYDYLFPPGSWVVVTDIDGTLTLSDSEVITQLGDDGYVPKVMPAGDRLMQAWAAKGYPVVYLTARAHNLRAESRGWLTQLAFPDGPLITAGNGAAADTYKALWLSRMIQDFGWKVVAAYGNAQTDITAYASAGIPEQLTFIIGPLSTAARVTGIPGMDFSQHIATFVEAQPANTP